MPLLFTIYALLSFKQFKLLGDGPDCVPMPDDAFFELPPDYTEVRPADHGVPLPPYTCFSDTDDLRRRS